MQRSAIFDLLEIVSFSSKCSIYNRKLGQYDVVENVYSSSPRIRLCHRVGVWRSLVQG